MQAVSLFFPFRSFDMLICYVDMLCLHVDMLTCRLCHCVLSLQVFRSLPVDSLQVFWGRCAGQWMFPEAAIDKITEHIT